MTMNTSRPRPDLHAMLGLPPQADTAELAAAYRRAVRRHHPDGPEPDREQLNAIVTAYRHLRRRTQRSANRSHAAGQPDSAEPANSSRGVTIPIRRNPGPAPSPKPRPEPALRAGPVRRHVAGKTDSHTENDTTTRHTGRR
ncbi:DnaJ domain-containing protein [Sciscionella sediminilitoris]|uniref:DnaJ domain-containing protein n=1 Tax=Sciscionella sediminilitoris TaxID=1445613 RepID=UPI0018D0250F